MKAAILAGKNELDLQDLPCPTPGSGEVLLRVEACGICGTDLHALSNGWDDYALGHEVSARVEETGADVELPDVGRRVAVECYSRCGKCSRCRESRPNLCENIQFLGGTAPVALAEYLLVPAYAVHAVPDTFTRDATVMVEPLAVALRAVRRATESGRGRLGIIGAGTIGLLCAGVAHASGAEVAILAKHDHQVEAAARMGADRVVQLGEAKPADALPGDAGGLDAVIDTVAQGTSLNTAVDVCRKGGRVVLVGEVTRPMLTVLSSLVHGEKTLTGSFCYAEQDGVHDFDRAISLISRGALDVEPLVTHHFPLAQVDQAFSVAGDKSAGSIKTVVTMQD